jgi:hypothetical protein
MGVWGPGLYEDDFASDLKSTISLVCKVPADGNRLLQILRTMLTDDGDANDDQCTFWLVVADQFERRGIVCAEAFATALSIIEGEQDLRRLQEHGLAPRSLLKRKAMLQELGARLSAPRPARAEPKAGKPPEFVVEVGEIYAFPTMRGAAVNAWFDTWEAARFEPDGWGALVVLQKGRAYNWLPWVSVASLTVSHERCPSFEETLQARLLKHPQTDGAAKCVPKRSHVKRMKMQPLGRVNLSPARAASEVSTWSTERALQFGWSLSSAAFSSTLTGLPIGPSLASLAE